MKKLIICVTILLSAGVYSSATDVLAASERIEESDIKNLIMDRSKEVPSYDLVPNPGPQPVFQDASTDNRSWKKSNYKQLIFEVSQKYNVDPQIIYATIMTESEGNPEAFRYEPGIKDASLCMGQILISTARILGFDKEPKELYQPETCIDLIGKYYRYFLDTYGDLTPRQLATAYNAGSPWKRAYRGHIKRFEKWFYEDSAELASNN